MKDMILLALSALLVALPMLKYTLAHPIQTKGEKKIRQAKNSGYTAQAHLIHNENIRKAQYVGDQMETTRKAYLWECRATFGYEVNGRTYQLTQDLMDTPPETVTVYFPSGDPSKAFLEGCAPGSVIPPKRVVLMVILVVIVYNVLRVIF